MDRRSGPPAPTQPLLRAGATRSLCARPGCQSATSAWLTYDYAGRRVWLDDQPSPEGGDQWALCSGHAGRLRAPKGWTQVDRRVVPAPVPPALAS